MPQHLNSAMEMRTSGRRLMFPPVRVRSQLQQAGEDNIEAQKQDISKPVTEMKDSVAVGESSAAQGKPGLIVGAEAQLEEGKPQSLEEPPEKPVESLLETVPDPGEQAKESQAVAEGASKAQAQKSSIDEQSPPAKAPHMDTPRHVHHFDTYGLVQRLNESGWTDEQAITVMKGMRLMLSNNMNLAREALVSKSQVENETYLFRAACAELKTEITGRRRAEQEKMRTERTQLQHEVDILNQKLNHESAAMKDEMRGMFDDRKMAVRNEQRITESKVQRLNYQITVDLQADAKSEVEGLRWVMTRRVIIALGTVIVMVLGSLKLYSNAVHEQELDRKRKLNMRSGSTQTEGRGSGGDGGGFRNDLGMRGNDMIVKEGDNPAYISLG
ncbi:mitochondrion protein [Zymoseptoria brevis]|uniref:Mitochondrion protein n=1 Tax=Zymoseptoria brevis TaxID=1047168 RepID=A0A0F4GH73_9PEZI|nr:mitochondrion protein [Zymoseptoria brevis]